MVPSTPVSVIIPTRNESPTIAATLESIQFQQYNGIIEIIVGDGSDDDSTAQVIRQKFPDVTIVPNLAHNTPAGMNRAIEASSGDIIVRVDGHAVLPPGYIQRAVDTLQRTGAVCVGGRQVPVGHTPIQRAIALGMVSRLGAGGSRYKVGGKEGPTDTVYLGVFRRDALDRVGLYDERMVRNQDYELNYRLRQAGGVVWYDPQLAVEYQPRHSVWALARQYWDYGRWKAVMLRQHPKSLRPRQLAAPLLVLGLVGSLVGALAGCGVLWATLPLIYAMSLTVGALVAGIRERDWAAVMLPVVWATMHLSWGLGVFISGTLAWPWRKRG